MTVSAHALWKYAQNSLTVLSNRHNFSPFIRNRGRWTRWWGQFSDRKQNYRYFCACALKKSSKYSENVFRQKSYFPVTVNGGRRSERRGQIFDRKLVNRRFCACAVKNRPKTRLLCCQIAKILAPLWAIAVADTTVFKPDKNLILSADCNKTANINVKNLTV